MWMRGKSAVENEERGTETAIQPIVDMGSCVVRNDRGTVHCLTVAGQIEGHTLLPQNVKSTKYEHVMPLLAGLEESVDVDGVLLLLNTVGGDVEAGLGIAEMIAGMSKPTVSLVLGGGHSIGVPLAVSAKKSFIVPSASMTVHPVRTSGTTIIAPQTYRYFERLQKQIAAFVGRHSDLSEAQFFKLLLSTDELTSDVGSVLYGEEAVQLGLIGAVGGIHDAFEALYTMIEKSKKQV